MQAMQCRVQELSVRHGEYGERIGFGKVVDFDRVVSHYEADGQRQPLTLGALLQGREDCFQPVDAAPSGDRQAPTPLDVDEDGPAPRSGG